MVMDRWERGLSGAVERGSWLPVCWWWLVLDRCEGQAISLLCGVNPIRSARRREAIGPGDKARDSDRVGTNTDTDSGSLNGRSESGMDGGSATCERGKGAAGVGPLSHRSQCGGGRCRQRQRVDSPRSNRRVSMTGRTSASLLEFKRPMSACGQPISGGRQEQV